MPCHFIFGYSLLCYLARKRGSLLDSDGVARLINYLFAGILLGGRLGYVLFTTYLTTCINR
jgi:prolipoprotein diacylglyceryltransferase